MLYHRGRPIRLEPVTAGHDQRSGSNRFLVVVALVLSASIGSAWSDKAFHGRITDGTSVTRRTSHEDEWHIRLQKTSIGGVGLPWRLNEPSQSP
jgi:hypothetical protein